MSAVFNHITSLVLVTGMSGAGKSTASAALADLGFFVIDNLPVPLFMPFLEISSGAGRKYSRTALLMDVDSKDKQQELLAILSCLGAEADRIELIFLDCRNEVILRRYHETRRPHPVFDPLRDQSLQDTISRERERLLPLAERASLRIDTSEMTPHDLKREIRAFADRLAPGPGRSTRVNFLSFGFKHGIPPDCDLIADVRFLPNPYFAPGLKERTGLDREVRDYVFASPDAGDFVRRYAELLEFLLPKYIFEGKSYLNIGLGCTGGRHRSVAIAEELHRRFAGKELLVSVKHRDIEK